MQLYKYILLTLFVLVLFHCQNPNQKIPPKVVKGVLDLTNWDFEKDGAVNLDGEWEFYWKEFVKSNFNGDANPNEGAKALSRLHSDSTNTDNATFQNYITVPISWHNYKINNKELGGDGYATYRLQIKTNPEQQLSLRFQTIGTAYILYVNGKILAGVGQTGKDPLSSKPIYSSQVVDIPESPAVLDILIHVSNFHHKKGGIWDVVQLGERGQIHILRENSLALNLFLIGSLLIMGFYHLGLFLIRRKDSSSLYFGMVCVLISLFSLLVGERYVYQLFPDISFTWGVTLEFLANDIVTPIFLLFVARVFPADVHKIPIRLLIYPSFFLALIVFFSPPRIFTYTEQTMEVITLLGICYTIFVMILAVFRKREGAKIFLIGFAIFALFIINDILNTNNIIRTGDYVSFGFFWFIFSQAFFLSRRFSRAFVRVEELSENLELQNEKLEKQNQQLQKLTSEIIATNSAYEKFVPSQFIELLEKEHITELTLGDQVGKQMSVLFSDIRSFTTLSESMSPEDNFHFINSYLSRIGPLIRKHNGFIDKYIGDAIMALFDKNPNHAIDAGIEMLEELYKINQHRKSKGRKTISIGIGIHTGNLTLGIIGEAGRMEGTVIADAVNLASRLESLTKMYGASILISEDMLNQLTDKEKYHFRKVDTVKVKGKNSAVSVVEILNGNSPRIIDLKLSTKKLFETGVMRFAEKNFEDAAKNFKKVLEQDSLDKAAKIHWERSLFYAKHGVSPDWEGVEALDSK